MGSQAVLPWSLVRENKIQNGNVREKGKTRCHGVTRAKRKENTTSRDVGVARTQMKVRHPEKK
jgi:hypothetical protein